ncbi:MAG: alpha/beta fold hydrolase [Planctomycetota bacterium]
MDASFFDSGSVRLLGCHHAPRVAEGAVKSIVICPPLGHEYIRSHWALRLLANQFARKGMHVLRFDYRGLGDSFGTPHDVCSMSEWTDDVGAAISQLKRLSGGDAVMLLGLRTGATLALQSAKERDDVHAVVAWEPVTDGARYMNQLRSLHQKMIDLWASPVETVNDECFEELLGTKYRRSFIRELEEIHESFGAVELPQLLVELSDGPSNVGDSPRWQRRLLVDDEDSWCKLCDLEVAWLRPKTSNQIVSLAVELFSRLENRAMLSGVLG